MRAEYSLLVLIMKLVKAVLRKLNGLHYPQEYLCMARESFQHPLHVYIAAEKRIIKDITNQHVFAGYHPLIFAFTSFMEKNLSAFPVIEIMFSQEPLRQNEIYNAKDALAMLKLRFIRNQATGSNEISYFEGIRGKHRFLPFFNQFIIDLNNTLFNKKGGNVFLQGNLYKQVQIAYAVPRVISLITVEKNQQLNVFPTDLHGPVDDKHYIISLRHNGKACRQVEEAKQILITQVNCHEHKTVYGLGKNHMQDFKGRENFPLGNSFSGILHLPLPVSTLLYRELELCGSFMHDIHKILLFKILSRQQVNHAPATLAHIHNAYATWRYRKGLESNYLLR